MVSVDGDGELLVRETLDGEKSQASAEELSFVGSSVKAALVQAVHLSQQRKGASVQGLK